MFNKIKYRGTLIITIFILLTFNASFAQRNPDTSDVKNKTFLKIICDDFVDSFNDGIKTYARPLHFDSKDWLTTGAVLLTNSVFYLKDESVREYSKKNHSDFNDKLFNAGTAYGSIASPLIIGGSVYVYGLFFKDDYTRVTGRMVFESVLYSAVITSFLKSLAGRYRPYTNAGPNFFQPIKFESDKTSFPSGHSSTAFAISTTLAKRIKNVYISVVLYTFAGITAMSRVYKDVHWASDAFFGSAIGYFIGDYITSNSVTDSNNKVSCKIYPGLNNINMVLSF